MIQDLPGNRCISVRRFLHRLGDQQPSGYGPVEFGWESGQFTTIDVNTDWTLDVSSNAWVDPFAQAADSDRLRLKKEVGLWELAPADEDLRQLIGRTVSTVEPILNEVGEITGIDMTFDDVVVSARVAAGNLALRVGRR